MFRVGCASSRRPSGRPSLGLRLCSPPRPADTAISGLLSAGRRDGHLPQRRCEGFLTLDRIQSDDPAAQVEFGQKSLGGGDFVRLILDFDMGDDLSVVSAANALGICLAAPS